MGAVSGSEGMSETSDSSNLSVLGRYSRPPTGKVSPRSLSGAETDSPICPRNFLKRRLLDQKLREDLTMHVRETHVPPAEPERQLVVVQSELMENRGVDGVDRSGLFNH